MQLRNQNTRGQASSCGSDAGSQTSERAEQKLDLWIGRRNQTFESHSPKMASPLHDDHQRAVRVLYGLSLVTEALASAATSSLDWFVQKVRAVPSGPQRATFLLHAHVKQGSQFFTRGQFAFDRLQEIRTQTCKADTVSTIFSQLFCPYGVSNTWGEWDTTALTNVIENLRWLTEPQAAPPAGSLPIYSKHYAAICRMRDRTVTMTAAEMRGTGAAFGIDITVSSVYQSKCTAAKLREARNAVSHANLRVKPDLQRLCFNILRYAANMLGCADLQRQFYSIETAAIATLEPARVERVLRNLLESATIEKLAKLETELMQVARALSGIFPALSLKLDTQKQELLHHQQHLHDQAQNALNALAASSQFAFTHAATSMPIFIQFRADQQAAHSTRSHFYMDEELKHSIGADNAAQKLRYPLQEYMVDALDFSISGVPEHAFHLEPRKAMLNFSLLMFQELNSLTPMRDALLKSMQWSLDQPDGAGFSFPETHFDGFRSKRCILGRGKGTSAQIGRCIYGLLHKALKNPVFANFSISDGVSEAAFAAFRKQHQGATAPFNSASIKLPANTWFMAYLGVLGEIKQGGVPIIPDAPAPGAAASPLLQPTTTPGSAASATSSPDVPSSSPSPDGALPDTAGLQYGPLAAATEIFIRLLPLFLETSERYLLALNYSRAIRQLPPLHGDRWTVLELLSCISVSPEQLQRLLSMLQHCFPELCDRQFMLLVHPRVRVVLPKAGVCESRLWPLLTIPAELLSRRDAFLDTPTLRSLEEIAGQTGLSPLELFTRCMTDKPVLEKVTDFFVCQSAQTAFVLPNREMWEQLLLHFSTRLQLPESTAAGSASPAAQRSVPKFKERSWGKSHFVFTVEFNDMQAEASKLMASSAPTSKTSDSRPQAAIISFSYLERDLLPKSFKIEVDFKLWRFDSAVVLLCETWERTTNTTPHLNSVLLPTALHGIQASDAKVPQLSSLRLNLPSYLSNLQLPVQEFQLSTESQLFSEAMNLQLWSFPSGSVSKLPLPALFTSDPQLELGEVALCSKKFLEKHLVKGAAARWPGTAHEPQYVALMEPALQKAVVASDGKSYCPVVPFFILMDNLFVPVPHVQIQRKIYMSTIVVFNFIVALCMFDIRKLIPSLDSIWNSMREQRAGGSGKEGAAESVGGTLAADEEISTVQETADEVKQAEANSVLPEASASSDVGSNEHKPKKQKLEAQSQPQSAQRICPSHGLIWSFEDAVFCHNCGAKFDDGLMHISPDSETHSNLGGPAVNL
jgi:hypothetical protein